MFEGLDRLGEERPGFPCAALRGEPFGVLELGDGELEDVAELAEERGGGAEALLDALVVASGAVEAGAQPSGVGLQ